MFKNVNRWQMAALIGVILIAGLAATFIPSTKPAGPTIVQVTENEWGLKLSVPSVAAGKVTFQVANEGKLEHELVLLKTDLASSALQMSAEEPDKVDEEASGADVGEVEDIGTGTTKSETFDLAPGKYVLICNVAGHYKAGMAATFEVK